MKSFFFHKPIAILLYLDTETVLKVRNLSKGMRYRIKVVLRDKKVFLNRPDARGNVLNGHIWTREDYPMPKRMEDFVEGLASYESKGRYEMEWLKEAFGEIYCSFNLKFKLLNPYFVERTCFLLLDKRTFSFIGDLTVKRADELHLIGLNSTKIGKLVGKINRIDFLSLIAVKLEESLSSAFKAVSTVELVNCQVKTTILLEKVRKLKVIGTESNNLVLKRLVAFEAENVEVDARFISWLKNQNQLKELEINTRDQSISVFSLPSSLRHLKLSHINLENSEFLLKQCPHLISFKGDVCLDLSSVSKIRAIDCMFSGIFIGESKLREVTLRDDNVEIINKYPEITRNCNTLVIKTNSFNFSNLFSSTKALHLHVPVSKSALLTRNIIGNR